MEPKSKFIAIDSQERACRLVVIVPPPGWSADFLGIGQRDLKNEHRIYIGDGENLIINQASESPFKFVFDGRTYRGNGIVSGGTSSIEKISARVVFIS